MKKIIILLSLLLSLLFSSTSMFEQNSSVPIEKVYDNLKDDLNEDDDYKIISIKTISLIVFFTSSYHIHKCILNFSFYINKLYKPPIFS